MTCFTEQKLPQGESDFLQGLTVFHGEQSRPFARTRLRPRETSRRHTTQATGSTSNHFPAPASVKQFVFSTHRRANARDKPRGAAEWSNERAPSPCRLGIGRSAPASLRTAGGARPLRQSPGGACAVSRWPRGAGLARSRGGVAGGGGRDGGDWWRGAARRGRGLRISRWEYGSFWILYPVF